MRVETTGHAADHGLYQFGSPPLSTPWILHALVEPDRQTFGMEPLLPELWALICVLLDPKDLLSLSHVRASGLSTTRQRSNHLSKTDLLKQTCRDMHTLISQRGVWLHAVESTCARYGLVYGNISTLDVDHLRSLALAPSRWDELCQSNSYEPASQSAQSRKEAATRKPLTPKSEIHFTFDYESARDSLHLVPGGRYLLASNCSVGILELYDLGLPIAAFAKPKLVTSVNIATGWMGFCFSVSEERVRVGLGTHDSSLWVLRLRSGACGLMTTLRLVVLEVDLSFPDETSPPAFKLLGSLKVESGGSLIVAINGDRAHIWHWLGDDGEHGDRWETVWDFKQHRYTSWYFAELEQESLRPSVSHALSLARTLLL